MPATPEYRPSIDGLRAIAVLGVFLFHLDRRWLPGGFYGVDVFFVISGYLITSIILRDCDAGRFEFRRFYQRRIARLLPAFFVVALATLTGAAIVYSPQDLASAGATLSAAAASAANLKFLMQGNYFALSPDSQPFLHCWSLSVEEQFYLLFPAALVLLKLSAWRRGGPTVAETEELRGSGRATGVSPSAGRILAGAFAVSFLAYLAVNRVRPEWAFYLLPTRAWELLAGSLLAADSVRRQSRWWIPTGLVLIGVSFAFGQFAMLPVAGAVCLLRGDSRLLASKPLVMVGRMSYSLYLWHWPVFSLVDYELYWQSAAVRVAWKIALSAGAAAVSFYFIEQPGRILLNRPAKRWLAYGTLAGSMATLIPLGLTVRNSNYLSAEERAVRDGGRRFNPRGRSGSMVLMGDSNGSMYGKMAAEIASERDLRLSVLSVEAGDPLPRSSGNDPQLWRDSLTAVRRERPDFLVLVCNWGKLRDDRPRLALALRELKPYARTILLITQPPVLPARADREAIRKGSRPPFLEDAAERAERLERNELVKNSQDDRIRVIDVEPLFSGDGGIRIVDGHRTLLYQDRDHLSAAGALLVKPAMLRAMAAGLTASR